MSLVEQGVPPLTVALIEPLLPVVSLTITAVIEIAAGSVIVTSAESTQPNVSSVTTTLYPPAAKPLIDAVVAPLDQA